MGCALDKKGIHQAIAGKNTFSNSKYSGKCPLPNSFVIVFVLVCKVCIAAGDFVCGPILLRGKIFLTCLFCCAATPYERIGRTHGGGDNWPQVFLSLLSSLGLSADKAKVTAECETRDLSGTSTCLPISFGSGTRGRRVWEVVYNYCTTSLSSSHVCLHSHVRRQQRSAERGGRVKLQEEKPRVSVSAYVDKKHAPRMELLMVFFCKNGHGSHIET